MHEYLAHFKSHDAGGVQYVNTFAIKVDPVGPDLTEPTAQNVADALNTWLTAYYRDLMAPDYTVDEVGVVGILGHDAEATHSIGLAGALSLSGTAEHNCPKELSLVTTLKTGHVGRSGRGRIFFPSPRWAEFMQDVTNWNTSSAYWTKVGLFCDQLLAGRDFTYAGGTLTAHISTRVWSRVDGLTRDVTSYTRRSEFHFLRSRRTAP
jgi:hypothetical protein